MTNLAQADRASSLRSTPVVAAPLVLEAIDLCLGADRLGLPDEHCLDMLEDSLAHIVSQAYVLETCPPDGELPPGLPASSVSHLLICVSYS